MVTPFSFYFRLFDRVDDIGIGGATAQISTHVLPNVSFGFRMTFLDASDGRDDLPWCAVSALKRVVIDEGLLHWMQRAIGLREALDRRHILAFRACSQSEAGQNTPAINQHRASTTLSVIASFTLFLSGRHARVARPAAWSEHRALGDSADH